jgi:hypothetical protein
MVDGVRDRPPIIYAISGQFDYTPTSPLGYSPRWSAKGSLVDVMN